MGRLLQCREKSDIPDRRLCASTRGQSGRSILEYGSLRIETYGIEIFPHCEKVSEDGAAKFGIPLMTNFERVNWSITGVGDVDAERDRSPCWRAPLNEWGRTSTRRTVAF